MPHLTHIMPLVFFFGMCTWSDLPPRKSKGCLMQPKNASQIGSPARILARHSFVSNLFVGERITAYDIKPSTIAQAPQQCSS